MYVYNLDLQKAPFEFSDMDKKLKNRDLLFSFHLRPIAIEKIHYLCLLQGIES